MALEIREVKNKASLRAFLKFPFALYKKNEHWIPPIIRSEQQRFSKESIIRSEAVCKLWIVKKNGRISGRIAAIVLEREESTQEGKQARFGWFDFIDDVEVSRALLSQAEVFAQANGCNLIKGPMGFSNFDKAGLLVEGFDELSTTGTLYNYPYYASHLESLGYAKRNDWKEYEATVPQDFPTKLDRLTETIKKRYSIVELPFHKNGKPDHTLARRILHLVNESYKDLEGFIPLNEYQIQTFVEEFTPLVHPDYICILGDENEEVVGFGITTPSLSKAIQRAKGRIFPFGILYIKKAMHTNDRADMNLIAVRPDYAKKGLTAIVFQKIIKTFIAKGIKKVETNPELEDNNQVQNLWRSYDMRQHKRRRCYQKMF